VVSSLVYRAAVEGLLLGYPTDGREDSQSAEERWSDLGRIEEICHGQGRAAESLDVRVQGSGQAECFGNRRRP
jgi:hypothetical protein